MKQFIARHSPLFILAALCLCLALYSENFRTAGNLQSVAGRASITGVVALGQLLVILTAGIDLSVGSVAALSGVLGCMAMKAGVPMPLGVLIGCAAGAACGAVNGTLVSKGRIPPFIATLGMMMAARGLALFISGGNPVFGLPDSLGWIGETKDWRIPIVIVSALCVGFAFMLTFTRFGRSLYAVGGNRQAARLSGIPVDGVLLRAYTLCGLMAGLGGMMLAAKTSIGAPMAAEMYELETIAACVIGGASLMGGEGGALASMAGALIMFVLRNVCNLENIDTSLQQVLVGVLVVALVFYDTTRKRRAGLLKSD